MKKQSFTRKKKSAVCEKNSRQKIVPYLHSRWDINFHVALDDYEETSDVHGNSLCTGYVLSTAKHHGQALWEGVRNSSTEKQLFSYPASLNKPEVYNLGKH
uniref:RT_RNaseH_2 domain-containing protein n=1 Tax=Heterorhabditis bacteriophora TaxID=37862 RepID=A0A1I7XPN0_HETBA